MVDTVHQLVDITNNITGPIVVTEFYDKNYINLEAQPHTLALKAILCEKGDSFNLLFY